MPNYKWLFFDADGTLLDYSQAEAAALAQCFAEFDAPYSPGVLQQYQEINEQLWREFEQGRVTPVRLRTRRFEILFERLGLPLSAELVSPIYSKCLGQGAHLIKDAYAVVQQLSQRHHIAILTNGLSDVQRARMSHTPLSQLVSHLVISEEIGFTKPARQYFERAMQMVGCQDKSTVLMIGDGLESDMLGAVSYGIDACWYNPRRAPRLQDLAIKYEIHDLWELLQITGDGAQAAGTQEY